MMVVLLIVGIGASMAALKIGSGTRPQEIKNATRLLYNGINLAFEEATYANQQFGLRFDIDAQGFEPIYVYQWLVFDAAEKRWFLTDIAELKEIKLPERVLLELEVEGQEIIIGEQEKDDEDIIFTVKKRIGEKEVVHPDIYFFSSGETQNFKISIADEESPENKFRLVGNMLGQVKFMRPDEEDE